MLFASKNGIFYLSKDKILNRPRGSGAEGRLKDAFWYVYYKFGADASKLSALKRAGDNPFKGAVRQISERLFKDDAGFYYLNFYSHSVYVTGRSGRHLDKRTNFIELRKITLDVHDDEVMAQIADEAARNPEMSQPVFMRRTWSMKTARPFICIASRRFYCSELGFIAALKNAACDAVKFSGAAEGKFRAKQKYRRRVIQRTLGYGK